MPGQRERQQQDGFTTWVTGCFLDLLKIPGKRILSTIPVDAALTARGG
jgi:hypothetical protein